MSFLWHLPASYIFPGRMRPPACRVPQIRKFAVARSWEHHQRPGHTHTHTRTHRTADSHPCHLQSSRSRKRPVLTAKGTCSRARVPRPALSLRPSGMDSKFAIPRLDSNKKRQKGQTYRTPPGCRARERLPQTRCLEEEEKQKTKIES